jgi:hypothetical protein
VIGVLANIQDEEIVREFFELFKTAWEPYHPGRAYKVLLCAGEQEYDARDAQHVLVYSGCALTCDFQDGIELGSNSAGMLHFGKDELPVYGRCSTSLCAVPGVVQLRDATGRAALWQTEVEGRSIYRIGYDLFAEIRHLLSTGQPDSNAHIPALELHIDLLRQLLIALGVEFAEIPPRPVGHPFIACLTHDVDHPSLKLVGLNHTLIGLLYRATIGSVFALLRRRIPPGDLLTNWRAAFCVVLLHLGVGRDFWQNFVRKYAEIEGNLPSTYFLIPFRHRAGIGARGRAERLRGVCYGIADIAFLAREITASGSEVALHGLDAWADAERGKLEMAEVRRFTPSAELGVRSHWLFFDARSPANFEKVGALYDSTVGYRTTVGYFSGTTQAYRLPGTQDLLELPMNAMDTALFSRAYLHLPEHKATERMHQLIEATNRMGGCLTINWHDRSIFPERLWHRTYADSLKNLKSRQVWFGTARQVTEWFRSRRAVQFQRIPGTDEIRIHMPETLTAGLPGLMVQHHNSRAASDFSTTAAGSADQTLTSAL